jgi:hypothetical protein
MQAQEDLIGTWWDWEEVGDKTSRQDKSGQEEKNDDIMTTKTWWDS